MAEVMAAESLIEAYWLLQGYWTKPRFAFRLESNQWSDIDVLAYHPEEKHLVVAESKVGGGNRDVWAFTAEAEEKYDNILNWDDETYFAFLRCIQQLIKDGVVFKKFGEMVNRLTIQLASNYTIETAVKPSQILAVQNKIRTTYAIPTDLILDVRLDSTLDVICDILKLEAKSDQGRRYGHPILDTARELNRYIYPTVRNAGSSESSDAFKKTYFELLMSTLRDDP